MPELISRIARSAGRGVLLLDDTCNLLAGTDDPAVAVRIVDDGGDDGRRGAGGSMAIDQLLQRLRPSAAGRHPTAGRAVPVCAGQAGSVVSRACAVPSCGSCTTNVRSGCAASAAFSASA